MRQIASNVKFSQILRFIVLAIVALIILFPLLWVVTGSLKPLEQVFTIPVTWIPKPVMWQNYADVWLTTGADQGGEQAKDSIYSEGGHSLTFTPYMVNSIVVTGCHIFIHVSLACLAGYGFAKHNFPGKEPIFVMILAMMLLPVQVIMVPMFMVVKQLGWVNSMQGLIFPIAVNAFGVFFMRQFISTIPDEYVDAARIDGAGEIAIFARVIVPMSKPAIATLALLVGLASWDEFLWPLIVVSDQALATLPLAISYLKSLYQFPVHWLLAVAVVMTLPPLLVFAFAQRRIVETASHAGLKG